MSTLKVNTIQDTTGNDALTIDSSGNVTASQGFVPSTQLSHRNIIINGDMRVSQRGTSFTGVSNAQYTVDRFQFMITGMDQLSVNAEQSTDAPSGFSNSLKCTVATPETTLASDENIRIATRIEAQDLQHLGYGTSDAKECTLSFWVKSSVTGTYACANWVADGNRVYGDTYTINSANTWEKKTISIPADTSGTINNDNGMGFFVSWWLSVGTNYTSSDNTSWAGYTTTNYAYGHNVNIATTSGATFQITGVQLEVGSVATPFEHKSYGEELARCQRYYEAIRDIRFVTSSNSNQYEDSYTFMVEKRANPTMTNSMTMDNSGSPVNGYISTSSFSIRNSVSGRHWHGTCYADAEL